MSKQGVTTPRILVRISRGFVRTAVCIYKYTYICTTSRARPALVAATRRTLLALTDACSRNIAVAKHHRPAETLWTREFEISHIGSQSSSRSFLSREFKHKGAAGCYQLREVSQTLDACEDSTRNLGGSPFLQRSTAEQHNSACFSLDGGLLSIFCKVSAGYCWNGGFAHRVKAYCKRAPARYVRSKMTTSERGYRQQQCSLKGIETYT